MNKQSGKRFDDKQKGKAITLAFVVAVLILVVTLCSMPSEAETVIEFDNGYTLDLPDGWEVVIQPEGFNSQTYDPEKNPSGKLPGWGGWPWYDLYLESIGCGEDDGSPRFSPQPLCPPQPEFTQEAQCYFEEPEPPCIVDTGAPVFSPHPPFCDERVTR